MPKKSHLKIFYTSLIIICLSVLTFTSAYSQFDFNEAELEGRLVEIKPVFSVSEVSKGKAYDAALIVTVAEGWHINSDKPFQDYLIPAELTLGDINGVTLTEVKYPKASTATLLDEQMSVFEEETIIIFKIKVDNSFEGTTADIPINFNYQPCNNKECRAPQTISKNLQLSVGTEGRSINEKIFSAAVNADDSEEITDGDVTQKSDIELLIEEHGVWGYFLALGLAFLTGLLLSFSPCTYPMIPITVSIFAGQSRSIGRGFVLSLFYVGTMAFVYGIMGLIVSLVGGVFGAWLASTSVVIGIAVVFVIFSLSMFGLYNIDVPMSIRNKLGTTKTKSGVGGAIVLGVIAALVVSPCVGPFVAGILLYIATFGSPWFGFLTLFVFAIGLGTLYIIIGTFSSTLSSLPGAGEWMETVKKFFGFVLLAMALYFLRTILPEDTLILLTGLLLLSFAVFGGGLDRLTGESGMFDRLKKFLGIIAFLVAVYLLLGSLIMNGFILPKFSGFSVGTTQVEEEPIKWTTNLEAGLARAKAEGKPVLIDTWAIWCANCKVLDKVTFRNENVALEAERFVSLKIQLEKSDSPESQEFMKQFGIKSYSLPTTLLLDSNGNVKKIMQGVVQPKEIIAEMQKVK